MACAAEALDARLRLAASLYPHCALGADIGTDHGLLPCWLLEHGVCERMILADRSEKALRHAAERVRRLHLEERALIRCADGLDAVTEPCGCVSVMGMGGQTIADILRSGIRRLSGATLILSAHTQPFLVRQALAEIGYRLVREEPCVCRGYAYLVWRAEPGGMVLTPQELRVGPLLAESRSPELRPYLAARLRAVARQLEDTRTGSPKRAELEEDLAFYRALWDKL
ncbi:MAG: SAM-dependent methyltransferase [Clostridia bacterium]|nr:SAM-dependent methyltransferase [Clostridia bacterium]